MNVAVVCFGFEPSNLRKQPWRYVHELVRDLPDHGIEPTVITDVDRDETAGMPVRTVPGVLGATGPTTEVVSAIEREDPDAVVALTGPTSFVRPSTIASTTDRPTIGLFAGPLYSPGEVLNVGLNELYRNFEYLNVHLAGSLVPDRWIRRRASAFDSLVTLTDEDRIRLHRAGVETSLSTIRPGIDDFDLELPDSQEIADVREDLNPEGVPMLLYFTSPLTLRGTDTLVEAFARVRRTHPCKLVVLSRQDDGGLSREESRLRRLARERSVGDSFELVPRNLTPDGVKAHLAAADVVALPFKIVLSSVPISLLEAMSVGNPVVSTRVGGIPELVDDERQLVDPGNPASLTRTLQALVADEGLRRSLGTRNRKRMQDYQRWDDARAQFLEVLTKYE